MTINDRIRDAVDAYMARVRADLDTHAQILTAELTRAVTAERAEWQGELDRQVADAREDGARTAKQAQPEPLAAVDPVRDGRVDTLERLILALRHIDESNSLTGILGALARGTAAETSRAAILVVDGGMFRIWEHLGFEDGTGPAEVPRNADESEFPGFMRVPTGHTSVVVPLLVGGDVVAVLYADGPEREGVPPWMEGAQLLARHAALRLESVTSVRAVEVLAGTD